MVLNFFEGDVLGQTGDIYPVVGAFPFLLLAVLALLFLFFFLLVGASLALGFQVPLLLLRVLALVIIFILRVTFVHFQIALASLAFLWLGLVHFNFAIVFHPILLAFIPAIANSIVSNKGFPLHR